MIRDANGTVLTAWTGRFKASTPFAAEAEAALQALILGAALDLDSAIF